MQKFRRQTKSIIIMVFLILANKHLSGIDNLGLLGFKIFGGQVLLKALNTCSMRL